MTTGGQKRIPSREGGVEVVVEELATRMAQQGYSVTCYNRGGHAAINLGKYLHHTEDAPPVKSLHFPFQGLSPNNFEFLSTDIGFIFWHLKRFIYFFGYGKHLDFIGILALAQVIS